MPWPRPNLLQVKKEVGWDLGIPVLAALLAQFLDVWVTAQGTLGNPSKEGNPLLQLLWIWLGPAKVFLPLVWAAFYLGVAYFLYSQGKKSWSLWILYAEMAGHLDGFFSWVAWKVIHPFNTPALHPFILFGGIIEVGLLAFFLATLHLRFFPADYSQVTRSGPSK